MSLSTLPFLFVLECSFFCWIAHRAKAHNITVVIILSALTIWGGLSSWLALSGIYDQPSFLALLPGFWLPLLPLVIIGFVSVSKMIRTDMFFIVQRTPLHWFIAVQMLRIAALGTLFKTFNGQFPMHVELAIGLNDLTFGLSAVVIFFLAKNRKIATDAIILWHIVGILIIAIPGMLAIQTGISGPMQIFSSSPSANVMLDFPLVLGPSLVVPIFFLFNGFGAWAAYMQKTLHLNSTEVIKTD